jgi:hypothetical protein
MTRRSFLLILAVADALAMDLVSQMEVTVALKSVVPDSKQRYAVVVIFGCYAGYQTPKGHAQPVTGHDTECASGKYHKHEEVEEKRRRILALSNVYALLTAYARMQYVNDTNFALLLVLQMQRDFFGKAILLIKTLGFPISILFVIRLFYYGALFSEHKVGALKHLRETRSGLSEAL